MILKYLSELAWTAIARIVTMNGISQWIVIRAMKTPYRNIYSADGKDLYMARWLLFNPYISDGKNESEPAKISWLPSIRVHHILRPDQDRHLHDHPWQARTIILAGWYTEERFVDESKAETFTITRKSGYTGKIKEGEFHRINQLSLGGVVTLFFTWEKLSSWGFLVDGKKINWKEYLKGD